MIEQKSKWNGQIPVYLKNDDVVRSIKISTIGEMQSLDNVLGLCELNNLHMRHARCQSGKSFLPSCLKVCWLDLFSIPVRDLCHVFAYIVRCASTSMTIS